MGEEEEGKFGDGQSRVQAGINPVCILFSVDSCDNVMLNFLFPLQGRKMDGSSLISQRCKTGPNVSVGSVGSYNNVELSIPT